MKELASSKFGAISYISSLGSNMGENLKLGPVGEK
jgi:hypothetical protein